MEEQQEEKEKGGKQRGFLAYLKSRDPLVGIGIVVLILGIALLTYGLIPQSQPSYGVIPNSHAFVPISDASGNFVTDPGAYYRANYNGTQALDNVVCTLSQSGAGYDCYGLSLVGTHVVYSQASQLYGGAMLALGSVTALVGNKFEPLTPREREHLRPISIRVDEGICVANGVCVQLAPAVFQLKKQEGPTIFAPVAYVVDPSGASNDEIIQAAQMCPTGAIILEDEETGERIHPPHPKGEWARPEE